jgi:hypothetical protein
MEILLNKQSNQPTHQLTREEISKWLMMLAGCYTNIGNNVYVE